MQHPGFFDRAGPFTLSEVARATGAVVSAGDDPARLVHDVRALDEAGPDDVSFIDNRKYLPRLATTRAGSCLVSPTLVERVPAGVLRLVTPQTYRGFALALALFYPDAMRPLVAGRDQREAVSPTARLEDGVVIEPGAVVGDGAEIGRGTRIAAGAVVGARVFIGRDCFIGPQCTVTHALIGNRVTLHAGVRIGQDGFGFAMGREGHLKVPQIGRVVIQDDVEIGANSTVDRGALKDTIIGEGTKIDNLVQIAHNVVIGRHCVLVAQSGIAGSASLGDFVIVGGQVGVVGHVKVGSGAQLAGASHPVHDVPPGARMGGTPARSLRQWGRELAALKRLTMRDPKGAAAAGAEDKSAGDDDQG